MNTKFNVLWFEDNDEWYEAMKDEVEEYISSLCFETNFIRYRSILDKELEQVISENQFDLVFADLNLDQSDQGNDAIKLLRDSNVLADTLFYSTDGIQRIKEVMQAEVLEGVYLSLRDDIFFPERAKKLIDKCVKRSEDILNIRGMLMDNVSEFDENIKETIRKFMSIAEPQQFDKINKYAYRKVKQQIENNNKKVDCIGETNFVLEALNETYLIDSYKLSMIVHKIFLLNYPDYDKMKNFHCDYDALILKERNKLAHAKKEPEKNGVFYFEDKEGTRTEYTSEKCKEIRYNINKYSNLLYETLDVIQ